jgi:CRISPR-associated protein Cas2
MTTTYVVAYDVSSDTVRGRVVDLLQGYGVRVQHSVFECQLTDGQLRGLTDALRRAGVDSPSAEVRFYALCRSSLSRSGRVGGATDDSKSHEAGIV